MIISLWASQNTSLSITQAAARLHIEHWMNFMVDLRTKKKGMRCLHPFGIPLGTASQAADLSVAACVMSSTSFLSTSKFGTLARDWTPCWSRIE